MPASRPWCISGGSPAHPAWSSCRSGASCRPSAPDLKLVLVAADPVPQDPARVSATLARAGLANSESWSFTDRFYERLRYEIDPAWAGELPRTLMIDRDGKAQVLPGVADLADRQSLARCPGQAAPLRSIVSMIVRSPRPRRLARAHRRRPPRRPSDYKLGRHRDRQSLDARHAADRARRAAASW